MTSLAQGAQEGGDPALAIDGIVRVNRLEARRIGA
jgi:hypothetical protein